MRVMHQTWMVSLWTNQTGAAEGKKAPQIMAVKKKILMSALTMLTALILLLLLSVHLLPTVYLPRHHQSDDPLS